MRRSLRYLRIAFSAACLIACVLLLALWVRSYWRLDGLQGPILWPHGFSLSSMYGRLMIGGGDEDDPITEWDYGSFKFDDPYMAPTAQFLGPVFAFHPSVKAGAYIHVPHWFPALITGSIAFALAKRRSYSLRTLLIMMTLVAIGLGLIVYYATHAKQGGGAGGGGGLALRIRLNTLSDATNAFVTSADAARIRDC
jgi:hypothetical protein